MEASWSCWKLKKPIETSGFSTFFKLLAVCFKWLQVGSSWPQVGSSWPQVGSSWPQVGSSWLQVGPRWRHVASSWPQVGSSCLQAGSKLAQVGPKISCGSLQEAVLEGPGRVQAGSWEALGAKRPSWRSQRWQNGLQVTPKSMKNE